MLVQRFERNALLGMTDLNALMAVGWGVGGDALLEKDMAALVTKNVFQRTSEPVVGTDENEAFVRVERQLEGMANGLHLGVSFDQQPIRRDRVLHGVRGEQNQ